MPETDPSKPQTVVTHILTDGTVRDSMIGYMPPQGLPPATRRIIIHILMNQNPHYSHDTAKSAAARII